MPPIYINGQEVVKRYVGIQEVVAAYVGSQQVFSSGQAAWNPLPLYLAGEKGFWYDPYDLTTMFQDVAGTIPVTASGQSVRKILDKSGNNNHGTLPPGVTYQAADGLHWLEIPAGAYIKTPTFAGLPASPLGCAVIGFSRSAVSNGVVMMEATGTPIKFVAVLQSGDSQNSNGASVGASTFRVDGQAVAGSPNTSRGTLSTAIPANTAKVLNCQDLTLTGWVSVQLFGYAGGFDIAAKLYSAVFVLRGMSAEDTDNLEQYSATKSGVFF